MPARRFVPRRRVDRVGEERESGLGRLQPPGHRRGLVGAEPGARGTQAGPDLDDQARTARRPGRRRRCPGHRRSDGRGPAARARPSAGGHRVHRGPVGQHLHDVAAARRAGRRGGSPPPPASARPGRTRPRRRGRRRRRRPLRRSCRTRCARPAAPDSSGSQRSRQVSRKVPVRAPALHRAPPGHIEQRQPVKQPRPLPVRSAGAGPAPGCGPPDLSRSRRCQRARSRASGTIGVSSGTAPTAVPTTSSSWTSAIGADPPSPRTAAAASVTSVSPASGRRRIVARASARRVASMTCAGETVYPPARSTAATSQNQRAITSGPAWWNRWWYHPGARTPAPYPVDAASRRLDHGTHVIATLT